MAGAGAVVARILTQYSDKGSKAAQRDIARLEKKINAFGKRAVQSFAVATAASAAFAAKIGIDAVKAAIDDQKSQEALAITLRNVTGATNASIASVEEYISKQQMLSNVSDNELRASLSKLVTVTGDVTSAMDLQSIAIDAAAGSGNSLEAVTAAIAKAQAGNFTSLKKMFPALDESIIKNKQLGKALLALDGTYKGAAKSIAKQDPIKSLSIAFGEISEQLGTALLPAVILFADYVKSDVIPIIETWISTNENGLNETLKNSVGKIQEVVKAFQDIYAILGGINAILPFGIGGWLKLVVAISTFSTAAGLAMAAVKRFKDMKLMYTAARGSEQTFKALRTEMGTLRGVAGRIGVVFAKIGNWATKATGPIALVTRGFMLLGRAILFTPWGRILTVIVALGYAIKKLADNFNWFGQGQKKLSGQTAIADAAMTKATKTYETMDSAVNKYNATKSAAVKLTDEEIARNKRIAAMNARAAEQAKKDAAQKAAIAKGQAALAKMGYKTTEDDPIQLEAARLNLIKQGNLAEAARIATMGKNLELQLEANKALARYNDLLQVLADKEITSDEVAILAKKWGMTMEAAMSYIQTLIAVSDQNISDDEITNLAKAWGVTKEQAAKYLDFFNYLNDGKLSDAEIAKLQSKWGLTSKEVGIYQDLITKASDYVLSDKEIEDLKKSWGLTTQEVIDYIKKLGQPVTFSGTLIDPATQAELGWKNALAALLAYQAALAGKGYSAGSQGGYAYDPNASADANKEAADAAKAAQDAASEAAAANDAATKAAIEAADKVLKMAAEIEATTLKIASGKKFLSDAQMDAVLTTGGSVLGAGRTDSAVFADEQSKFRAMNNISPTLTNSTSLGSTSSGSGTTVNLVVNGSVSTEQDLVTAVRNGLLATQTNGNQITLQAI